MADEDRRGTVRVLHVKAVTRVTRDVKTIHEDHAAIVGNTGQRGVFEGSEISDGDRPCSLRFRLGNARRRS